jgi:hypothetical protein
MSSDITRLINGVRVTNTDQRIQGDKQIEGPPHWRWRASENSIHPNYIDALTTNSSGS